MDNKAKTGKADDTRININETYELQYWSEKMNVTRERLKEAVAAVGPNVDDVKDYLKNSN
jgi:hypothetical protein